MLVKALTQFFFQQPERPNTYTTDFFCIDTTVISAAAGLFSRKKPFLEATHISSLRRKVENFS